MRADAASLPRRILMTADTVGGVWTYALELARALAPHGVEVAIATMGALPNQAQRTEVSRLHNVTLFESAFRLEWMADPWRDVQRAGAWLLELERRLQPDVVHLNGYAHGQLRWRAPVVVVGHSCVLSWWRAVKGEAAPPEWTTYRREVSRGLGCADLVIAPTRAMLLALEEHYGVRQGGTVIPNGRDVMLFAPRLKGEFILTAGRLWDEAKNVLGLTRVAPRLSWPVYVAGENRRPDGGAVQLTNVNLLGQLSSQALADWFARASIYAQPARYEPFGLSVLEAALAGCALVLGDIPSLREVWGDSALFVPPEDTRGWQAALTGLIADRDARWRLAARARQRALAFSPARMASGYLAAYATLMSTAARKKEASACAS